MTTGEHDQQPWTAPRGPYRRQAIEAEAVRRSQEHPEIRPGVDVLALTADGRWLPKTATTGIVAGGDFPVVWVRSEHEAVPWPSEDVRMVAHHNGG